ncbi:Os11g0432701 [Oryza sativa Japonica Group]|uniref:Os11g0432701 protein n=1 Tax=Oryza sativa subsp. japonica TaxID=39947 RepID=A0A0P0Y1Y2_ORYSJ|nr:Os11g0432701 [Oryza sativa Japonica Group]
MKRYVLCCLPPSGFSQRDAQTALGRRRGHHGFVFVEGRSHLVVGYGFKYKVQQHDYRNNIVPWGDEHCGRRGPFG